MTRTCKNCGDSFEVLPYGWKRQYCQRKCQPSRYYRVRHQFKPGVVLQRICETCDEMFAYEYINGTPRKYCSKRCYWRRPAEVTRLGLRERHYVNGEQVMKV